MPFSASHSRYTVVLTRVETLVFSVYTIPYMHTIYEYLLINNKSTTIHLTLPLHFKITIFFLTIFFLFLFLFLFIIAYLKDLALCS